MTTNYIKQDVTFGELDLDEEYITDAWLVEKYVGNNLITCGYNNGIGAMGISAPLTDYSSPIQVGSLTNWKQVSTVSANAFAIKTDGTLWAWGSNATGRLGVGTTTLTYYSSPVQIGALTNWKQIADAAGWCMAVKTDGTLWGWGTNGVGNLGNGATVASYSSPSQVGSLTTWKQVACGRNHSAAVKTDGTLWTWGQGNLGQLGNSTTLVYSSPIQVGSATNWKQVSCGGQVTVAIATNGTLWNTGNQTNGSLGNGVITGNISTMVQLGSDTNWRQVSTLGAFTMAIKTDGTLWGWGYNLFGCLGAGDAVSKSTPVQIGSLTNWKSVHCGYYFHGAIRTDGTAWVVGYNNKGQLGQGNTTNYSSHVQLGSSTKWKQISCGYSSQLAALTFTDYN
jgi:alpha-tubulin suppressor-like RCC1 family protein